MVNVDTLVELMDCDRIRIITFMSKIVSIAEGKNDRCTVTLVDGSTIKFDGFDDFAKKIRSKF